MITETNLAGSSSSTDATSYSSASITPTANRLVLISVYSRISDTASNPNVPSVTGNSLTWVQIDTVLTTGAAVNRRITIFRAMGASPTTGTVTMDFSGQTQTACIWSIAEFDGIDTSGTNGSGAIVQSKNQVSGSGTSYTMSLSALGSTDNASYGANLHFANEATTHGTGFTEIHDIAIAENNTAIQTEWKINDATLTASWATSTSSIQVGCEIKASSGTAIKTINGLAKASVKTYNGLAIASVKTINGLA